jgi:WD40 repeat protein
MKPVVIGARGLRASRRFHTASAARDASVVAFIGDVQLDVVEDGVRRSVAHDRLDGATAVCALSPDGRLLACGGASVVLLDVATLDVRMRIARPARSIGFSPDGALLAIAHDRVTLFSAATGELHREIADATTFAFDRKGARIACGSRVLDVATGEPLHDVAEGVACFVGSQLVSLGEKIAIVDLETGARGEIDLDARAASAPRAVKGGELAFVVDASLVLVDPRTGRVRHAKLETLKSACAIAERGGELLVFGAGAITPEVRRLRDLSRAPSEGHTREVTLVAESPTDRVVATASGDGSVILWDLDRRTAIGRVHVDAAALGFSADGKRLAIAIDTGRVALIDLATRTVLDDASHALDDLGEPATAPFVERRDLARVAISPDGKRLAIACWHQESIELVDTSNGATVGTAPWGSWLPPACLRFSRDAHVLYAGSEDGALLVLPINA